MGLDSLDGKRQWGNGAKLVSVQYSSREHSSGPWQKKKLLAGLNLRSKCFFLSSAATFVNIWFLSLLKICGYYLLSNSYRKHTSNGCGMKGFQKFLLYFHKQSKDVIFDALFICFLSIEKDPSTPGITTPLPFLVSNIGLSSSLL